MTDDQWISLNGPFAMAESHLTYTNGVVDVPAGTVLQLRNFTGSPPLAASDLGDQLLAYVGNSSNPTFLCGIDTTAAGWFVPCAETCDHASDGLCDDGGPGAEFSQCAIGSDCADCGVRNQTHPPADRSFLPSTLVDGYSALAFGHYDNNAYRGTNIGNITQLRAAITSAPNWAKSNSIVTAAINVMTAFEVLPSPPPSPSPSGRRLQIGESPPPSFPPSPSPQTPPSPQQVYTVVVTVYVGNIEIVINQVAALNSSAIRISNGHGGSVSLGSLVLSVTLPILTIGTTAPWSPPPSPPSPPPSPPPPQAPPSLPIVTPIHISIIIGVAVGIGLAVLVLAFLAGRYCMYCCYAKPKPKPKGKDGKTLTHTPSKKALRDPNAARAEAYAKVLRDPKTSRRKEAAKNDVEYAAETAAVPAAVSPTNREHEERERRAKKEATASELLPAPALAPLPEPVSLPEARPEQSLPTFRAVTNFNNFFSQVISARFSPHAPAAEPANNEVVAPAAVPEMSVTDDPPDLSA